MEILDDKDVREEDLKASLDFMVRVNRYLGGAKAILDFFERFMQKEQCRVLDLGTGAGDIPHALVQWAEKKKKRVDVTAIDVHPFCLHYAKEKFSSENIHHKLHSAFDLTELGNFDYIIASMFFHHLTNQQIVVLLKSMLKNATQGFIVNDLYRHPLAYYGAAFLSLPLRSIVYHDAKLSVKRAFTEEDFYRYRNLAGIHQLQIRRQAVFRLIMYYHV